MKKVILATLVGLGTASSAFAVTAQSGVYVGASAGWSFPYAYSDSSMVSATQGASSVTHTNKGLSGGAEVGYQYAVNPNFLFGLESGYDYFGKLDYDYNNGIASVTFKEWGIPVLLTGTYLAPNGFNVFAKLGAEYTAEDVSGSNINIYSSSSIKQWLPVTAVGVGYMPTNNVDVTLQYKHLFGDNNESVSTPISKPYAQSNVMLGVSYKFGA